MTKKRPVPHIPEPGEFIVPDYVPGKPRPALTERIVAATLREVAMALGRAEIAFQDVGGRAYSVDPFKSRRALSAYLEARADELDPPNTTGGNDVTVTLGSSESS